jgi:toxin ParE1/3/4
MVIRWSEGALEDRLNILRHIAEDSVDEAVKMDVRFEKEVDYLLHFPYLGRKGLRPGSRLLPVRKTKYLIAYMVGEDFIEVKRVLHGSQDLVADR